MDRTALSRRATLPILVVVVPFLLPASSQAALRLLRTLTRIVWLYVVTGARG